MLDFLLEQPRPLLFGGAGVLALLILGTLAAMILPRAQPGKWIDLGPRMHSWWIIVVLFGGALLAGPHYLILLMAFVSFVALREFVTIAPTRKEDRVIVFLAYVAVAVNYAAVWLQQYQIYLDDVAQYCWGKAFGRTKITPRVSSNKTWEGAIGGWITAAAVFVWLAPYFTPLKGWPVYFVGATLPVLGFAGDVTMSAVKRDLGVKDTSHLIPGHGGALDRLDSLTFTAPWYFHWLAYFALQRF